MVNHSLKVGFSFGLASGIITTLGLIVGLYSSTRSLLVIFGAILTIAVADAFSDAFGIHLSEESENKHSAAEVFQAGLAAFLSKFVFSISFIWPFLVFELPKAIGVSVVWAIILLTLVSFYMAREQKKNPLKIIAEHLIIVAVVIILTYYLGQWIAFRFNNV